MDMPNATVATPFYNDNQACVNRSVSVTNKGTKHINLWENKVPGVHTEKSPCITHIPGIINASNIFTKEIKDAAHYPCLRDTMIASRANFLRFSHTVPVHLTEKSVLAYYSIMSHTAAGEYALSADVISQKDPTSDDTFDDDDAPSCQRVSVSCAITRDESRDSQKISQPSLRQFSRPSLRQFCQQGGVDVSPV